MAARELMLPANRAFNGNGVPVAGAKAYLYLSGGTTPANFYSDSTLITSLGSVITANAIGRFPLCYQDSGTAFRLIIKNAAGTQLDDIDPFYFGQSVIDFSALYPAAVGLFTDMSALTIPTGIDIISTTGYSALDKGGALYIYDATVDSTYVAANPRSSFLEAGGRGFKLSTEQEITPAMLGEVGDNVADDHLAVTAAVATSSAWGGNANSGGFYVGGPPVNLTYGKTAYMGSNGLNINHTVLVRGGGGGRYGPGSRGVSALRYGPGACGILIQGVQTHGSTGTDVTEHAGAGNVGLEHLMLQGPEDGVEDIADIGVVSRKQLTTFDVYARGFRGVGFQGLTGTYGGVTYNGDVSMSALYSTKAEGGMIGYWYGGPDANLLTFINSEAYQNYQAGFVFDAGIGAITGIGLHTASNGMITGHLSYYCHHNGDGTDRWYAATWGKTISELTTNAPPNGPTSNTYWNYVKDAAPDTVVKTWNGTQQFRAGGDCLTAGPVNVNQVATFISFYAEEPGISQFGGSTLLINSVLSRYQRIGGVHIYAQNHLFVCDEGAIFGGNLTAHGITHTFGDNTSATVANTAVYLDNTSTESAIFARTTGGTVYAYTAYDNGGVFRLAPSASGHSFSVGTVGSPTAIATVSLDGITCSHGSIGYGAGVGGTVTQGTNRTTAVTLNKVCGEVQLFSAAGSAAWQTFTVNNNTIGGNDMVRVWQKSGTDKYQIHVTKVVAGTSFDITYATTGGTTTEQPVFGFSSGRAVIA